ncbi:hypothetical protein AA0118_g8966 [Alternaria tenuissima]|nr:hypothetical protein AA0115_g10467 [Alternaria tenuissima]RYN54836.1 hypothetical protein AA0118_g8966 [Alternaria tenuissima]
MDLPGELFDNVIAHYVHSVPVHDASATRAVSRAFDQAISYQMIANLSQDGMKVSPLRACPASRTTKPSTHDKRSLRIIARIHYDLHTIIGRP